MGFNTKLNLNNQKMYQGSGDTLTLSGETIIHIGDDGILKYSSHPNFTGATPYNNPSVIVDKKYIDDKITILSADTIYNLSTPTTVTLGGIASGTQLTGKTSNEILEELLVPALEPAVTAPSSTFVMGGDVSHGGIYEIGVDVNIAFTSTFNRGLINPYYDENGVNQGTRPRSGLPNTYRYSGTGLSDDADVNLTNNQNVNAYTVLAGSNQWGGYVSYDAGSDPVRNSKGVQLQPALIAGNTSNINRSFTGILPYFYGTSATQPTANQALIDSGSKTVANSDGTITINYGTVNNQYLWFAIPNASTTKQGWYVTDLNKGNIGTSGDLFNAHSLVEIDSPDAYWIDENYKIYITNYATSLTQPMQMRNAQQA